MYQLVILSTIILSSLHLASSLDQVHCLDEQMPVCDKTSSNNLHVYSDSMILVAVNYHELYKDFETFVDMPLKYDPEFGYMHVENINKTKLQHFVNDHISPTGSELIPCTPTEWNSRPAKLMAIADPDLREWVPQLNAVRRTHCRRIDPAIENNSAPYSLIYFPHVFIMPGGRFREFYYWDAYWIIKGFLACEMYSTTRAMIENLGSVVERFGFVSNSGRVYYFRKSQPPLLAGMAYEYYEETKDKAFVAKMLPILEKELDFWNNN